MRAPEQYNNLFDCLQDTEDEMIKLFMELGYSNSELKQLFEVRGVQTAHQDGIEGQRATDSLHRRTLDRIIGDTPTHSGEQDTKTENTFSFSADSGTAQEVDVGGGMVFPFYGFSRPSTDYFKSKLILRIF